MTISDLITEVNSTLAARGIAARASLSFSRRTIKLRGTPFIWGIDAYPIEVLRAEISSAADLLAEANPLEAYRKRHRLSYQELAGRLAMLPGTVNAYCRNLMSPSAARRRDIEAATAGEVPAGAAWPLPPRNPHRPGDPRSRRGRRLAKLRDRNT